MGDGEGLSLLPYHTKPAAGAAILIGKSPDSRFNPSPFLLNFPHAKATQEKDEVLHLEPQLSRSSPQDLSERGGGGQWDSGHAQHTQRCHDKGWHHQGPSNTDPPGQWCGLEQPWYRCGRAGSQLRRTAISKPKLTYCPCFWGSPQHTSSASNRADRLSQGSLCAFLCPFPILISFQRNVRGCYLTFGIAFQPPDRTEHTWETSTAARGLESRSATPFRIPSQALLGKGNMQNLQENRSLAGNASLGVTLSPSKGKISVWNSNTPREGPHCIHGCPQPQVSMFLQAALPSISSANTD